MAYENFIADCITRAYQGEENNSAVEVWADSIVRAQLAGFLLENVDAADPEAVAAEVSNCLAQLPDIDLDDLDERCENSSGNEEEASVLAWAKLKSIKEAAQTGLIDEKKVLKLVIEHLSEISGN